MRGTRRLKSQGVPEKANGRWKRFESKLNFQPVCDSGFKFCTSGIASESCLKKSVCWQLWLALGFRFEPSPEAEG